MSAPLVTRYVTLGALLGTPATYVVPHYQREYAWEQEHALHLVDAILSTLEQDADAQGSPCFLGTMLLYRRPDETATLEIVDGQQRLVTLTMLLSCLRDAVRGETGEKLHGLIEGAAGPTLRLRNADIEYFQNAILTPRATRKPLARLPETASASHTNMRQNRSALLNALRRLEPDQIQRLAASVPDICSFVVIEADDLDFAHQIFLSINERGKDLTLEDIFQAELVGPLDEAQQARYAPVIDHIGKYRRETSRPVSRAKTFFSHYVQAHGWRQSSRVSAVRADIRRTGGPSQFVSRKFVPFADAYLSLTGLEPLPAEVPPPTVRAIEHLQMLEVHGNDDWLATAMIAMTRFSPSSTELQAVVSGLDRYAHMLLLLGLGATERQKRLGRANTAIRTDQPLGAILSTLSLSRRDERQAARNLAQRLHVLDRTSCRLFLIRLDAALSGRDLRYYLSLPEYPLQQERSFTVEHLIPKGARIVQKDDLEWTSLFPNDRHRQACAQYLGNLTLIRKDENKEIGQWGFRRKLERLTRSGPHPIQMNNELAALDKLDFEALGVRHRQLMKIASELWQLIDEPRMPPSPPSRRHTGD